MRILLICLLAVGAAAVFSPAQARRAPGPQLERWKRDFLRDYDRRLTREMNRLRKSLVKDMEKTLDRKMRELRKMMAAGARRGPRGPVASARPTPERQPQEARRPTRRGGRPYLGVQIGELSDVQRRVAGLEKGGLLIAGVVDGSGAKKGGVKSGDVLIKVDGKTMDDFEALRAALSRKSPGDKVSLLVSRDGAQRFIDVKLGAAPGSGRNAGRGPGRRPGRRPAERPEPEEETVVEEAAPPSSKPGWLGVFLADDYSGRSRPDGEPLGIEVEEVAKNGPAAKAGLKAGDVLLRIDGKAISGFDALKKALTGAKAGKRIVIELRRGRAILRLRVQLGSKK